MEEEVWAPRESKASSRRLIGVGVEVPSNPVWTAILAQRIVNHHHNQFRVAIAVDIRNSNSSKLVLKENQSGMAIQGPHPPVDVSVHIELLANAIETLVSTGRIVNHEDE